MAEIHEKKRKYVRFLQQKTFLLVEHDRSATKKRFEMKQDRWIEGGRNRKLNDFLQRNHFHKAMGSESIERRTESIELKCDAADVQRHIQ